MGTDRKTGGWMRRAVSSLCAILGYGHRSCGRARSALFTGDASFWRARRHDSRRNTGRTRLFRSWASVLQTGIQAGIRPANHTCSERWGGEWSDSGDEYSGSEWSGSNAAPAAGAGQEQFRCSVGTDETSAQKSQREIADEQLKQQESSADDGGDGTF